MLFYEVSVLVKEAPESSLAPPLHVGTQHEKTTSVSQKEGPRSMPGMPAP